MDITWYGQSCFKLKGKTTSVILDPFDPEMVGLKHPKDFSAPLVLVSHNHGDHNHAQTVTDQKLLLEGPGEYEFMGVTVTGTSTFHDDTQGSERGINTVYNLIIDGINVVHLGDLGHTLTEPQVNEIGNADIVLIPVGGTYTINAKTAAEVVAQLEPKLVIPMHYQIDGLKIELEPVDNFLKEMGSEAVTPVAKLSITKDKLPEETQVVVLSKS